MSMWRRKRPGHIASDNGNKVPVGRRACSGSPVSPAFGRLQGCQIGILGSRSPAFRALTATHEGGQVET